MDSVHIQGGIDLQGKVRIQGSKNAALPVLAATLLTKESSCIRGCPRIADVYHMVSILRSLGCRVVWEPEGLRVDPGQICKSHMPAEAIKGMRSSLCLLGALAGRCREVIMEYPGGCVIGKRPIDLHIKALSGMGVEFSEDNGKLKAVSHRLHGAELHLPFPSVGATENILLAAVQAEGTTRLHGAALEPEVEELCLYLQKCGGDIEGVGTSDLVIRGGRQLYGADVTIRPDRIVAGTYLFACIGAGGSVLLEGAPADRMEAPLCVARQMGGRICLSGEGVYVQAPSKPLSVPRLETAAYPGFPTDLQSMALAVMTVAEGKSVIEERIFENRFRIVPELASMGADIYLEGSRAEVTGVKRLCGRSVLAKELRGGAALMIAGLMAEGETVIGGCPYIYRGYENICKDLRELGARIVSV